MPYIFIDGAIEMEDVEVSGEKIEFSENAWKKAYRGIEESFPKRTVQGWFICGAPSSQLSPLNYWKQHNQYFNGKNKLMYLNHGLEGEEAVYVTSEDGFYRLKGHCIYYERNQMMQDYMVTRKDVRRVESGSHEKVIKDFRQRMTVRKEQADAGRHMSGILGTACGVLTVAVLAGGVVLVNNYHKMRQMESVLTSVVPAGTANWSDYLDKLNQEPDLSSRSAREMCSRQRPAVRPGKVMRRRLWRRRKPGRIRRPPAWTIRRRIIVQAVQMGSRRSPRQAVPVGRRAQ